MKIGELLKALIDVAEKGASIARIIRSESSLLELLVQEKKGEQKNSRFVQDFKTLADVLVQEVVRYDLSQKFSGIEENIYGEESNKFTNTLGDSVTIQIHDTAEKTKHLLSLVLDDNVEAAGILADVIHKPISAGEVASGESLDQTLLVGDVGVWIDPIDSTAQYIQGEVGEASSSLVAEGLQCVAVLIGVYDKTTGLPIIDSTAQYIQGEVGEASSSLVAEGLQCVAVLIGVYDKTTGLPIIGVANQPFSKQASDGSWTGATTWGVCYKDIKVNSLTVNPSPEKKPASPNTSPIVLISSSEAESVQTALKERFSPVHVAGAGYKLLGVCQNLAAAYVLTKNSNYKWDCCGPHAILRSLGGGVVNYTEVCEFVQENLDGCDFSKFMQIKYHIPDQPDVTGAARWCNDGGIIAYLTRDTLEDIGRCIVKL